MIASLLGIYNSDIKLINVGRETDLFMERANEIVGAQSGSRDNSSMEISEA